MSPKFVLILNCLLPLAVLGQTIVIPYSPITQSVPVGLVYYPENNVVIPGQLHFSAPWNFVFDNYEHNSRFPTSGGQSVFSEPLSLSSMIRHNDNKMGASAIGGVVYTGSDDVFAYGHYGRTGKVIWRTSPIANNMMATRWSLANFNIFRRASLPSIPDQLR